MGIFSVNYNLAENVFLATCTFDKLDVTQKEQVVAKAKEIIVRGGLGAVTYDHIRLIERYSLLALGMFELGIAPNVDKAK